MFEIISIDNLAINKMILKMSSMLTAAGIAEKFNLWIRFQGIWFTPNDFRRKVDENNIRHIIKIVMIMNPVEALTKVDR